MSMIEIGSIDDELDADFFGSDVGVVEDLGGWHVALNGRTYLIDVTKYERAILDSNTPQTDDAAQPGEKSLSRLGFWPREQTDWSHGAGQELFDDPEESDRRRFFASKGMDVWVRGQLCLLPGTDLKLASTEDNLTCFDVGDRLYVVDGINLRFTADPTPDTPSFTTVNCDNAIVDWTTDGNRIYLAFGGANVLKVVDVGGAVDTTLGAATPDIVEFANGRLIGADGKILYELDSVGVPTTIRDDPRSGWLWRAVVGHPEAIFAAGTVNDLSEFYAVTPSPTDTALTAPVFAGSLRRGETVVSLAQYQGLVVIGTSDGIRVATVTDRKLSIGELIEIPGDVRAMSVFGRFCWFTWTNYDTDSTGLGRLDLSVVTSPDTFVPAWASDIMAGTEAAPIQGVSSGVAQHNGRRYFTIVESGVWGETGDLVADGFLDSGDIRYGVLADKIFTGVEIQHDPLEGSVGAVVTFNDDTSRSLGVGNAASSVASVLDEAQGSGLSVSLRIIADRATSPLTAGPCIRSWILNALPRPRRVTEIVLPLILKTRVVSLRNVDTEFDPLEEVRRLDALASSAELVTYQEGDATYQVRVSSVAIGAEGVRSWTQDGTRWFQATVLVRLLTKES